MHLAHWNTKSLTEHKALDDYYNGILPLVDEFVEVYFGQEDRQKIVVPQSQIEDSEEHLSGLRDIIEEERAFYTSNLQNTLDEMLSLIDRTLYMLTLK